MLVRVWNPPWVVLDAEAGLDPARKVAVLDVLLIGPGLTVEANSDDDAEDGNDDDDDDSDGDDADDTDADDGNGEIG